MFGMIIPPEVIGPGATVGSRIGPVGVMMPVSGLSDRYCEREVTEGCEDAIGACEGVLDVPKKVLETCEGEAGICAEVLDVGTPDKVPDDPSIDGEGGVKALFVVDDEAVVTHVEYRVAVPVNHVVFAVSSSQGFEDTGPGESSQSQCPPMAQLRLP